MQEDLTTDVKSNDIRKRIEDGRPPAEKLFYNLFKKIGDYNEGFFQIMRGDKCVGLAGNKQIQILVDFIGLEDLGWLGSELALISCREYGDYVFRSNDFPPVKLIGSREKKNAVKYYMNYLLRASKYYEKAYQSEELMESVPFNPPIVKRS